jgi:hypothetical protein
MDTLETYQNPSMVEPEWIEQQGGGLNWGDEQRRWRRMEARPPNRHGQMTEREEAERMPHTVTTKTAGARRNRATRLTVTHSRQRGRERLGLGLGLSQVRERRGCGRLGRAGPV